MQLTAAFQRPAAALARLVLRADGLSCVLTGIVSAAAAAKLPALLGFGSTGVFLGLGAFLFAYGEALWFAAGRAPGKMALMLPLICNALWVLASLALVASGTLALTTLGYWAVLGVADVVALMGALQWWVLRRMAREAAAA
ncbi:MAG TPA: hypothetical protein VGE07_29100 [Herpetosiphonaceae bacterium]